MNYLNTSPYNMKITHHASPSPPSSAFALIRRVERLRRLKSRITDKTGFSIPELIMGVLIIGIAFVAAMYAHSQIQFMSTRIESSLRSTSLANSVMSIIRSHNFDENDSPPWSTILGPEEGSSADYDDVDDYAGYDWPEFVAGYIGYSITSRVFYVNPSNSWIDSTGVVTNFKRIIVSVNHGALQSPIVLTSLITPRGLAEEAGLGAPPPPPPGL